MKHILSAIKSWFTTPAHYSELERFIVSNNPQNNAHVEALEREFDSLQRRNNWARGS
jgi:hypothetical protein